MGKFETNRKLLNLISEKQTIEPKIAGRKSNKTQDCRLFLKSCSIRHRKFPEIQTRIFRWIGGTPSFFSAKKSLDNSIKKLVSSLVTVCFENKNQHVWEECQGTKKMQAKNLSYKNELLGEGTNLCMRCAHVWSETRACVHNDSRGKCVGNSLTDEPPYGSMSEAKVVRWSHSQVVLLMSDSLGTRLQPWVSHINDSPGRQKTHSPTGVTATGTCTLKKKKK